MYYQISVANYVLKKKKKTLKIKKYKLCILTELLFTCINNTVTY